MKTDSRTLQAILKRISRDLFPTEILWKLADRSGENNAQVTKNCLLLVFMF